DRGHVAVVDMRQAGIHGVGDGGNQKSDRCVLSRIFTCLRGRPCETGGVIREPEESLNCLPAGMPPFWLSIRRELIFVFHCPNCVARSGGPTRVGSGSRRIKKGQRCDERDEQYGSASPIQSDS